MEGCQRSNSTYMKKNCEDKVRARIGNLTLAKEAYNELKKAYQGKPTTEFYVLLDSLTLVYDDRKSTIEEHITAYKQIWNIFVGVMSRADLNSDDEFERDFKELSKSDKAKAEFLLKPLPSFYANTVENIREKDHEYDCSMEIKGIYPATTRRAEKGRNTRKPDSA
jgi:hypothetical protein